MNTILVLSNSWVGLYSFRKEVFLAFREKNFDIFISSPNDDPEKARWFEEKGCKIIGTPFNRKGLNPIKDISLMLSYRKLISDIKPDAVLTYTIKPNVYGGIACQICGVPQIANITGLGSAVENPGALQRLAIFLYRIGLRKAYTVFFQNEANKKFCLEHNMVKGYNKLIPGSGVNIDYHSLQEYPSKEEPLRFIFISRLLKQKGIEEFFAAAINIKKRNPNSEFHVVGWCEDSYLEQLKELEKRGIVIYHGPVSDVRPMIGMAHCTVHPSFYPEGMSNVLLESCAAGRPIITTDRPGCGEIVDDGVNGFVVKQQNADDLTAKIEKFIALPYEKKAEMGLAARKKVEREFDRQIVVKAYLDAVNEIQLASKNTTK